MKSAILTTLLVGVAAKADTKWPQGLVWDEATELANGIKRKFRPSSELMFSA